MEPFELSLSKLLTSERREPVEGRALCGRATVLRAFASRSSAHLIALKLLNHGDRDDPAQVSSRGVAADASTPSSSSPLSSAESSSGRKRFIVSSALIE
jgi:hypothetical protein